jgi:hypothetical protein
MFQLHGALLAIAFGMVASALARADEKKDSSASASNARAPYVHVVIFTIKKDAPDGEADKLLADCHDLLGKIPTVRELRAGTPAEKSTEIAKKDYQVGLMILFDDFDGLKTYLDHKLHQEFLERHKQFIDEKVLGVYDFADVKK